MEAVQDPRIALRVLRKTVNVGSHFPSTFVCASRVFCGNRPKAALTSVDDRPSSTKAAVISTASGTTMMTLKLIFTLFIAVGFVGAQDAEPDSPTQPNIAESCNAWHTVREKQTCPMVEKKYDISHKEFLKWNPDVSDDCSKNFWVDYAYCVGVGPKESSTSSKAVSSSTKVTLTTSRTRTSTKVTGTDSSTSKRNSTITTSPSTTKVNTTYSIREPTRTWNLTTPTVETKFPPQRTQSGQPKQCKNWHYVLPGDTCQGIISESSWVTMEEFLDWNPSLGSDCSGLNAGWWVCIGVQPQTVTVSFGWTTTPPSLSIPTYVSYTPTDPPDINTTFVASPTQSGLAKDCEAFYQAGPDDTCQQVLKYGFPSREQFFEWNPALDGKCGGLWENYWYCVAVSDYTPMPPIETAKPSSVPIGQPDSCKSWYKTTNTDTCDDIVLMFGTFAKDEFITWNPSVKSDCSGIRQDVYYCVGVEGTPTTRTEPLPTTKFPGETPTPSGVAPGCKDFWLVSDSDTCAGIADANGITEDQFFSWNFDIGDSSCDNLVPDSYVCVGVEKVSTSPSDSSSDTVSSTRSQPTKTGA